MSSTVFKTFTLECKILVGKIDFATVGFIWRDVTVVK